MIWFKLLFPLPPSKALYNRYHTSEWHLPRLLSSGPPTLTSSGIQATLEDSKKLHGLLIPRPTFQLSDATPSTRRDNPWAHLFHGLWRKRRQPMYHGSEIRGQNSHGDKVGRGFLWARSPEEFQETWRGHGYVWHDDSSVLGSIQ